MSGWQTSRPSRPPWDTQEQPTLPAEGTWYGGAQGPRVIIKAHEPTRGGRASRFQEPLREADRNIALAGVIVGLAASVGLIAIAVQLTHVTWGKPAAAATPIPTATADTTVPTPGPTASSRSTAPAGGSAAATSYVLSAPAKAGGYSLTTPISPTVQAIGTSGATELMTAVEAGGGTVKSNVSAEYFIAGDQVLGYAGYNGSFSPEAVMRDFQVGAADVTSEPAGSHGGQLACGEVTATSPASSAGEACVWATTTTIGMVEFYDDNGGALESVMPAKAGSDTLKFRDDVETAKG
jgi:hypothetical protein